jgi:hypothetical protein
MRLNPHADRHHPGAAAARGSRRIDAGLEQAEVRVLDLAGLGEKGDVSDWIADPAAVGVLVE